MALNYPTSPTVGQVFDQWTWNGDFWALTPEAPPTPGIVTWYQEATPPTTGSNGETWYQPSTDTLYVLEAGAWTPVTSPSTGGFTFITDTAPTPTKAGDTWFDLSTGPTGGTSWVAISEVPGAAGPLVWVQFAPGSGSTVAGTSRVYRGTAPGSAGIAGATSYTVPNVVTVLDVRPADWLIVNVRTSFQYTGGQGMSIGPWVNGASVGNHVTGPIPLAVPIDYEATDYVTGYTGNIPIGFRASEWYGSNVTTLAHIVNVIHVRG